MPELLKILAHLPSGWALIALALIACVVAGFLVDWVRRAALPEKDNGGWK